MNLFHDVDDEKLKPDDLRAMQSAKLRALLSSLTSNKFSIRKLGRKWGTLHRLAYVAAAGGTLHFWQLVKADTTEPWRWAAGFALLFAIRVWWAYRPRLATSIPNAQRPIPNHSQLPTSKNSQR